MVEVFQGFSNILAGLSDPSRMKSCQTEIRNKLKEDGNKFLFTLVQELMNPNNVFNVKFMAAILFKNTLKNATKVENYNDIWYKIDPQTRQFIKDALFSNLGKESKDEVKCGAVCVAAIAVEEIPRGEWPEVINILCEQSHNDNTSYRMAALTTLGYITEDLDIQYITVDQMNNILFAVLSNINPEQRELSQISAAAFSRAAPFTGRNFEVDQQRDYIMQAIYKGLMIDDEEIQVDLLKALCDIARTSYKYLQPYLESLMQMTANFMNSESDKAANLAVEFWTSLFEVDIKYAQDPNFQSIILPQASNVINLLLMGISQIRPEDEDQNLSERNNDETWTTSLASACSLEHLSQVLKDEIINPVLNFIQQKLGSQNWEERNIGIISFGAILLGPNPLKIIEAINQSFEAIINMVNDPVPKVRCGAAWVMSRMADNIPQLILSDQQKCSFFVQQCLNRLQDHYRISVLISSGLGILFRKADEMGAQRLLNQHFIPVMESLMSILYREDMMQYYQQGVISNAMNDIVEKCDAMNQQVALFNILNTVLREIQNIIDGQSSNNFTPAQKEDMINHFGGLCQVLIVKISSDNYTEAFIQQICNLILNIYQQQRKITSGGLLIFNGLTNNVRCDQFLSSAPHMIEYILDVIQKNEDPNCSRLACGQITDIANTIQFEITRYIDKIVSTLLVVLISNNYAPDTKAVAIIALGDICLQSELQFEPFLDETMKSFHAAGEFALKNYMQASEEDKELILSLRVALLEAFGTLIHGMVPIAQSDATLERKCLVHVQTIFHYLEQMIIQVDCEYDQSTYMNIYELYSDILQNFGHQMLQQLEQSQTSRILINATQSFQNEECMETLQRFQLALHELQQPVV